MTIKRRKTGRPAAWSKRRLRPAGPKVARARSSEMGEITSKPMLIGYARVSTVDQNLALQRDALTEAGCAKIFIEQMSGAVTDRPAAWLATLRRVDGHESTWSGPQRPGRPTVHRRNLARTKAVLERAAALGLTPEEFASAATFPSVGCEIANEAAPSLTSQRAYLTLIAHDPDGVRQVLKDRSNDPPASPSGKVGSNLSAYVGAR